MTHEPAPMIWEPELLDSKLEADLTQSIENARRNPLPRDSSSAQPSQVLRQHPRNQIDDNATLAQLVGGCGIAVVDGYLHMKEYAATKGLDLAEMHHKGIDAQDLISTLLINCQRKADQESGAKRWKR